MRKTVTLLAACAGLGLGFGPASAQTFGQDSGESHYSCVNDMMGGANCQDADGHQQHVRKDTFGETVTDEDGNTARVQHDKFGNTTIFRQDGSVVQGHTDSMGATTYMHDGEITTCRPSPVHLPGQTKMDCE